MSRPDGTGADAPFSDLSLFRAITFELVTTAPSKGFHICFGYVGFFEVQLLDSSRGKGVFLLLSELESRCARFR